MKVLLLLTLISVATAMPKSVTRIVGGSPTTIEQYSYMSNMQYNLWGLFWFQSCGGSLITSTTVLSAAHCYQGDRPSEWRVRLGSSFVNSGGTIFNVFRLLIHPEYSRNTFDADVAIVELSTPAVLSETIQPARVAGPNYNIADGTPVVAAGWGALTTGGSSPDQLHHVEINIINQKSCEARYAFLKTQPGFQNWPDITDGMICAGILDVGGKDACQGDSGGPLAHNGDILVGITSWGYKCADPVYPGVNARVSYYANWIANNA